MVRSAWYRPITSAAGATHRGPALPPPARLGSARYRRRNWAVRGSARPEGVRCETLRTLQNKRQPKTFLPSRYSSKIVYVMHFLRPRKHLRQHTLPPPSRNRAVLVIRQGVRTEQNRRSSIPLEWQRTRRESTRRRSLAGGVLKRLTSWLRNNNAILISALSAFGAEYCHVCAVRSV